jgi:histidinol-phosphatase
MTDRLAFALNAVYKAGKSTVAQFQTGIAYSTKSDSSPLTVADLQCEQILRDALAEYYPGEAILGEEQGATGTGSNRWIIDPIDGTKSFIAGVPTYATLLSYEEEGVPILGICYFPALDEMIYASRGEGCYFNGRRCQVSSRPTLQGSILACGGIASMIKYGRWDVFAQLSMEAMTTRTWSDAFGHALVATGRADAMVDPVVSRWDLSAIRVIIEEAGGKFTDFRGGDPFIKGDYELEAVSANPHLHAELIAKYRAS